MQGEVTESSYPTKFNIAKRLPLRLIKSEIIPPAPNRREFCSEQAIDWLYDFAGYTWIAYGAASLLVISHFPNPLSESESLVGPIFRQVFELSVVENSIVSAVSWSPATPASGDLAAAVDNCIGLFSYNSDLTCNSSFCWGQNAILVQSTKVETIKWTVSGDAIIAGGIEVVLWRKKEESWERAWKFKPEVPHTLISACWSREGPFATAPLSELQSGVLASQINEASKCVVVSYSGGDSKLVQAELWHPLPISMIQWRPSTGRPPKREARNAFRSVLLTGSLDGTVRLWSESDDGRVRRTAKESNDPKVARLSFRVVAVVEVNQALNGMLGSDVFVKWGDEIEGIFSMGNHCFSSNDYQHHNVGSCEWLIGFGPQLTVTLWAIHCLDDFSPLRFPRVTLWKTQELISPEVGKGGLLLNKVFVARNKVFSPPIMCSLVELLPCNSLAWLHLYSQILPDTRERSTNNCHPENILSSHALGILDIDSYSGSILQVAVHPYLFEIEVAASLDASGMLLFWSLSTALNGISGLPTLKPSCKLSGRTVFPESHPRYASLSWTPAILNDEWVLIMGHAGGIDCFIVKDLKNEKEKIACHYFCTIPFGCQDLDFGQGPTSVCSMPFPSSCNKAFTCDNFLIFAIWKSNFQALSWKVSVHRCDLPGNCFDCNCNTNHTAENGFWLCENEFFGKRYRIDVEAFSSIFPASESEDKISSFSVVCPTNLILSEQQERSSANQFCSRDLAYHMVTGSHDGIVKLWRSVPAKLSNSLWELVGKLAANQGPVVAISPSVCGGKIATVSHAGSSSISSTLRIWECVHLRIAGNFVLEDTICLGAEVVSLNWVVVGDGQSLLGVCLPNELKIYARWCNGGQALLKLEQSVEEKNWVCIAVTRTYPAIHDFFWGPRATVGVIHRDYFCLFSQLWDNKKHLENSLPKNCKDNPFITKGHSSKNLDAAIFSDSDVFYSMESSAQGIGRQFESQLSMNTCFGDNFFSDSGMESCGQKNGPCRSMGLWSLSEVADKLAGSLPVFHPEALLLNISSGNWKRAYVALQHLVKHLSSAKISGEINCFGNYSHTIPLVPLSNYLEGTISSSLGQKTFQWSAGADVIPSASQFEGGSSQFSTSWEHSISSNAFTSSSMKSEATDFTEAVGKVCDSAGITNNERMQIFAIIDILKEVGDPHAASAYGSLDEPGRRFWVAVKFQQNFFVQRFGRLPSMGELVVSSGLIGWAFHSDCQENLFNSLLSNEPSWQEMRDLGVGFWYTNTTQLRLKMEKLARQQYLKYKDPKACALLYIALNRLQVLAGLFKLSKDEKDKPLFGFLARNFQEDKNKAAALKNAYVLMGKHQLELAIAFFLLGGDASSAVTVCAKNLGDEQLALVICRLVEGYGGPLENNLISKVILPSAISRGDSLLASVLEWVVGNYPKAFLRMLAFQKDIVDNESALSTCQASFRDPSIGQYCLILATTTSMKNAIGEQGAAVFGQWALWMTAIALRSCRLPLEALECLSLSLSIDASSQGSQIDNGDVELQKEVLKLSPNGNPLNWISGDLSSCMELHTKLDLAMKCISQLLKEHPSWGEINIEAFEACIYSKTENQEHKNSVENFHAKLAATLVYFQQKYSLIPFHLINKIMLFYCSNGLEFIGHHILCDCFSRFLSQEHSCRFGGLFSYPTLQELLLKRFEEVSYIFSRYIVACNLSCSQWKSCSRDSSMASKGQIHSLAAWDVYQHSLIRSFQCLRAALQLFFVSCAEDFLKLPFAFLDLCKFYAFFASVWIKMNYKDLAMTVKPLLMRSIQGDAPHETIQGLNQLLSDVKKMLADDLSYDNVVHDFIRVDNRMAHGLGGDLFTSIPEDERWLLMGFSLWGQVSSFLQHLLCSLPEQLEQSRYLPSAEKLPVVFSVFEHDANDIQHIIALESLSELLKVTCSHVSVYCGRQIASYLLQKEDTRIRTITLCLEGSQSQPISLLNYFNQNIDRANMLKGTNELSPSDIFWLICTDPKIIHGGFMRENSKWFEPIRQKVLGGWKDMYISILREVDAGEGANEEERLGSPRNISPLACHSPTNHPFLNSGGRDAKKVLPFNSPKEIYRRPGELLEALSINTIDQCQAALATNRKGIVFFNLQDGLPKGHGSEYIWAEADWPLNGWAGSESTPVPTCVSPGVGLGSRKGTQLGLGGATIGTRLLARPGRDVMNGGAFGIPGYAGMGLTSLGWGIQEDFEQFVDTPPTVESVRASSFSTHPSRPLFLVGSSNTHIYLWEFGKDRATATYGVLPAANVPPPYALASISAVEFDHCGQRFVTAALDGTVCTWQLEVGGRSNVRPTESSICFDNHTSDVTYVTASGSIVAAAGYSSTGVNVVIWDTLAPSATSRASIMCHEGGARSLSVFDNNIGTGSISPFIVTGGKSGDVGLHDFRYIATGRTKKHKQSDANESVANTSPTVDMRNKNGDQNRNGMLWYIPKAHSGTVTKIATIPNTSFFLTGSKDGDVKLWDAKAARLVFHWPKLHERYTFLQPGSHSFGGIVRAAVTDIQVLSHGFLTCGGDGSVKLVKLTDFACL